jgi:probable F420-dependent oxidoreductase
MKQIKIGVGFGLFRLGLPEADTIIEVAERAEEWGLDSFWLSDHLLAPSPELDVVATLALLASRTKRIKLGPSVFLLNLRHPLAAAKSFATLDYLSHGRIVMAVGTGANLDDYAACGIPLEGRGRRLDEGIMILRKAWTEPKASFHGKYFNFDNVSIEPRPVPRANNDSGTIDIWVGGRSEAALKRTARFADGYFASFQTPEEFSRNMAAIRGYAAGFGRANARIEAGLILFCRLASTRERAMEDMRPMIAAMGRGGDALLPRTLYGSPADIMERLGEYAAAGLDKFVLWPVAEPSAWKEQIELIGREIASHYTRAADAA